MKNLILFLMLATLFVSCDGAFRRDKDVAEIEDPCLESAERIRLEGQIELLNWQVTELKARLSECQELVELVPKKSNGTRTTTTARTTPRPAPKPAAPQVERPRTPVPSSPAPRRDPTAGTANISNLGPGKVVFSVLVDCGPEFGSYFFPQLALDQNVTITNFELNPSGDGTNFSVEPTPAFEGDYGVSNGTFYISKQLVNETLESKFGFVPEGCYLTLYAEQTNWGQKQPNIMTDVDGWYLFETK